MTDWHVQQSRMAAARRRVSIALVAALPALAPAAPPLDPLTPPLFSIDLASPSATGPLAAADVLESMPGGPIVAIDGADLEVVDVADDLDAFSSDVPHPGAGTFSLIFSVDCATLGAAPPDATLVAAGAPYNVTDQAARRQACGDLFISTGLFDLTGALRSRGSGNNCLVVNQFDEGGTSFRLDPQSSAEDYNVNPQESRDEVDAAGETNATTRARGGSTAVYFSLIAGSPTLSDPDFPGSASPSGAHIFYNADPGNSSTALYISRGTLGLSSPDDDVDALVVFDIPPVGTFSMGDVILFSLAPGSPTLSTFGGVSSPGAAADVFVRSFGSALALFATAGELGLGASPDRDNVDALSVLPCEDGLECAAQHGIRRRLGDCDNDGQLDGADAGCLAGCWHGPDVSYDTDGVTTYSVSNGASGFAAPDVVIEPGDTVKWTWTGGTHNVVSGRPGFPDGAFSSGTPTGVTGTMFSVTFNAGLLNAHPRAAYAYPYYCSVHGDRGTVIVRPDPCWRFDFDGDGDVDLHDAAEFQTLYGTP